MLNITWAYHRIKILKYFENQTKCSLKDAGFARLMKRIPMQFLEHISFSKNSLSL